MCDCFEANKTCKNIYGESLGRSFSDNQFLPVTSSQNPPYEENNFNIQSPYFKMFIRPWNWFQGMISASLCSLAARYDNSIPPRFLAPIDFLKIPAQYLTLYDLSIYRKWHSWGGVGGGGGGGVELKGLLCINNCIKGAQDVMFLFTEQGVLWRGIDDYLCKCSRCSSWSLYELVLWGIKGI